MALHAVLIDFACMHSSWTLLIDKELYERLYDIIIG